MYPNLITPIGPYLLALDVVVISILWVSRDASQPWP